MAMEFTGARIAKGGSMKFVLFLFVAFVLSTSSAHAADADWKNVTLTYMKLMPNFDYQAHADDYMAIFQPDIWRRVHNDEFELPEARQKTIAIMQQEVAAHDPNYTFLVNMTFTFGEYKSDQQGFPMSLNWRVESQWVDFTTRDGGYDSKVTGKKLPRTYRVYFKEGFFRLAFLSMEKQEARNFLQARKNDRGETDRTLYATATVQITMVRPDLKDEERVAKLDARILSVAFFRNEQRDRLSRFPEHVIVPRGDDMFEYGPGFEGTIDLRAVVEKAKKMGKKGIYILYHASWAGPSNAQLEALYQAWAPLECCLSIIISPSDKTKVVVVDLDGQKMSDSEFAEKLGVSAVPEHFFMTLNGIFKQRIGLVPSDGLSKWLEEASKD